MTSVFTAISFIKTVSRTSALAGVATYRCNDDEFVDYNYKLYASPWRSTKTPPPTLPWDEGLTIL
nr:8124_t:CDS:2 [Entrophospora candida]